MARRRSSTTKIVRVSAARAPSPIIKVSAPRAPAKKHRRRRSSGGGGSASLGKRITSAALGGAVLGLITRFFPNLPTIPLLGRSGSIAVAIYFLKPKMSLLQDAGVAAAAIAGNELASKGSISGDNIAPQVHGIASQV